MGRISLLPPTPGSSSQNHPQGVTLFPDVTIRLGISVPAVLVGIGEAICVQSSFLSQAVFSHKADRGDCI